MAIRSVRLPLWVLLSLALATSAPAVIIDSGDGTGNVTAPSPDPGWAHIGTRDGAFGVVYLGSGWVLTANHVGTGNPIFGGVSYPWVPGTDVRLHNLDDSLADLVMFRIYPPYPPLPALAIRSTSPPSNTDLILVGNGPNRGSTTTWSGHDGYNWLVPGQAMRWGTNDILSTTVFHSMLETHVFETSFDEFGGGHTTHEAQAGIGDSGGPVFERYGSQQLTGVMIAVGSYPNQPAYTSFYGQVTYVADLSIYRDEIVETMPEPHGGLAAGAALLLVLASPSAGTRRASRGTRCAASSPPRA